MVEPQTSEGSPEEEQEGGLEGGSEEGVERGEWEVQGGRPPSQTVSKLASLGQLWHLLDKASITIYQCEICKCIDCKLKILNVI